MHYYLVLIIGPVYIKAPSRDLAYVQHTCSLRVAYMQHTHDTQAYAYSALFIRATYHICATYHTRNMRAPCVQHTYVQHSYVQHVCLLQHVQHASKICAATQQATCLHCSHKMQHAYEQHTCKLHTCRIHATDMQHTCNRHATCMQHACNTHARCMQHACNMVACNIEHASNIHAAYIQHTFNIHAIYVQHTCCNIHSTYMQHT